MFCRLFVVQFVAICSLNFSYAEVTNAEQMKYDVILDALTNLQHTTDLLTKQVAELKREKQLQQQMILQNQQDLKRKDKEISQLKDRRQDLSKRLTTNDIPSVFFTAENSNNINHIGDNQAIIFNHVVSDEGGGYDNANGIFRAQVDGVYVFFVQIRGNIGNECLVDIVRRGDRLVSIWTTKNTSDSSLVVYRLHSGDSVWIRNRHYNSNGCTIDDLSSFSGFLLHK